MRRIFSVLTAFLLLALASWQTPAGEDAKPFVAFRMQEFDEKVEVGYAVLCVDVNGDGKKDIVVVDTKRVIWFENPTWKVHTIIRGLTKPDNVCIDACDIDGDGKIDFALLGAGNQDNPKGKRGASEIKQGKLGGNRKFIVTIEPWHGEQVVVYTPSAKTGELWDRHVIDEQLRWGHGVACADLDGDGNDEIIIGVRDDPNKTDKFTERRGVRVYKALDANGTKWQRQIIDNGGIAVEDLTAVDLNGDGKIDIVAVGRATHNVRIYWNETKK